MLTPLIEQQSDNGLLHLARANIYFRLLSIAPPPRRPVLQRLAVQDLDRAEEHCPGHPEIALVRIYNTLQLEQENLQAEAYLSRFPNEAHLNFLLARHAQESGDVVMANALAEEAFVLNGANMDFRCLHQELLQSDGATNAGKDVTCLD